MHEAQMTAPQRALVTSWFENNGWVDPWARTPEDYAAIDLAELAADPEARLTMGERQWAYVSAICEKMEVPS